jgi:hypothetical protein
MASKMKNKDAERKKAEKDAKTSKKKGETQFQAPKYSNKQLPYWSR